MRIMLAAALSTALMGCEGGGFGKSLFGSDAKVAAAAEPAVEQPLPPSEYAHLNDAKCYTVELYDEVKIEKPAANVPPAYSQFLGAWENGAWNGDWCHDLLIFRVEANGKVHLLDMHEPSEEFGLAPSVFKRVGRIHEDGSIRFAYGTETRRYWLRRGVLFGKRSGSYGAMEIALTNPQFVPLPVPRPVRAAKG